MGAGDELGPAAGLRVAVMAVLADQPHEAEAHDDGLRRLEARVDLCLGQGVAVPRIGIRLEHGQRNDGHGLSSRFGRRGRAQHERLP
jgi:hypothetical protein